MKLPLNINKYLAMLAVLLCSVVTGCKEQPSNPQTGTPAPAPKQELVLYTWEDYINPEVVQKFTDQTGISVRIEVFQNLSEMEDSLRSNPGSHDLVVIDDFYLAKLIDLQLVEKFNRASVPNIENIQKEFMGRTIDPLNEYSIPYLWGTMLVAYRSDKIESPEQSWSLLWDESLKGKIAILEDSEEVFGMGLLSLDMPLNSSDLEEIKQATDHLVQHAKEMHPQYLDLEVIKGHLDAGKVWAATCYSGDALMLAEENEDIDCFIPNEGAPVWIDNFVIVKDAPNRANAHSFMNFMAEGENAAQNAEYVWTATPNEAAVQHMSMEFLEDETVFLSPEVFELCDFFGIPTPERIRHTNEGMMRIMEVVRVHIAELED